MLIRSVDTIYIKLRLGIEIHVKPGVPNIRPRGQNKPDKDFRVALDYFGIYKGGI